MLVKSLEFKNAVGQKVKVIEIPVLAKDSPYYWVIQSRLQSFTTNLYRNKDVKMCYSFREYLKRALKWPIYEKIFELAKLKSNA